MANSKSHLSIHIISHSVKFVKGLWHYF